MCVATGEAHVPQQTPSAAKINKNLKLIFLLKSFLTGIINGYINRSVFRHGWVAIHTYSDLREGKKQ